ncbi:13397_t:CDS:2 [Gigaspora rosea]|nr:13397_t:CDS:2 [Gigaspora rosea]
MLWWRHNAAAAFMITINFYSKKKILNCVNIKKILQFDGLVKNVIVDDPDLRINNDPDFSIDNGSNFNI